MPPELPSLVLFGAFDRHNLGDLLFARVAQAFLAAPGRARVCAGLADRDLRPWGGPRAQALHRLAAEGRLGGATLVHVGGEILDCTADQAATMLLAPDAVDATLAGLAREPARAADWRRAMLGADVALPYVAGRDEWPMLGPLRFAPVGGVAVDRLTPGERGTLARRLSQADGMQVRDRVTQAHLAALGVTASLAPDPVETLALPAPPSGSPSAMRAGSRVLAVQLSAEFDDDATLDRVADALAPLAQARGWEVEVFRAGAAPWHDDPRTPAQLAERLRARGVAAWPFQSVHVDALVGLLAGAAACACASLHGLVVAAAHGVPVAGLRKPGDAASRGKLDAYVGTWHAAGDGVVSCDVEGLAEALARALDTDPDRRRAAARERGRGAAEALSRLAPAAPAGA